MRILSVILILSTAFCLSIRPALARGQCDYWNSQSTSEWKQAFADLRAQWNDVVVTDEEIDRWLKRRIETDPGAKWFTKSQVGSYIRAEKYNRAYGSVGDELSLLLLLSRDGTEGLEYDYFQLDASGIVLNAPKDIRRRMDNHKKFSTEYEILRNALANRAQATCAPSSEAFDADALAFEAAEAWEKETW